MSLPILDDVAVRKHVEMCFASCTKVLHGLHMSTAREQKAVNVCDAGEISVSFCQSACSGGSSSGEAHVPMIDN